jgi:hypothetical protein
MLMATRFRTSPDWQGVAFPEEKFPGGKKGMEEKTTEEKGEKRWQR